MKKLYLILFSLLLMTNINAQDLNTIVFVDKNGNQFADGSTIIANSAVEDDFGDMVVHSGLYVKNISTEAIGVRIHVDVKTLESGMFQICFPIACIAKSATVNFETGSDLMSAGEQRDLQTEWIPQTYGKATVTYQIELMKQLSGFPPQFESLAMGPKVTVEYLYADPTSICIADADGTAIVVARYGVDGRELSAPQRGLNIVRYSDGRVVKTFVR